MDYLILIFSGVVMGLIAAVPIGPVNLICVRRTFAYGSLNGFVSGLGAALEQRRFRGGARPWPDLGIAAHPTAIPSLLNWLAGRFLVFSAFRIFMAPVPAGVEESPDKGGSTLLGAIISTFLLTITNPATLVGFTAMFAGLGGLAGGAGSYVDAGFVVAGVVAGSTGWWLVLTTVIGLFHAQINDSTMKTINRVSGALVGLFGLAVLTNLVIKVF